MINRENYTAILAYFKYRSEVIQVKERTAIVQRGRLKHLLTWAGETPLYSPKLAAIRPTFPAYMAQLKPGNSTPGEHFKPDSARKVVDHARAFFTWAKTHRPEYKHVSPAWIDTLRPVRMHEGTPKARQVVTPEMVRGLLAADWPGPRGERAKAAAAFLFLSGIRATAFCTLPIEAVDLDARKVKQFTALGVKTKNSKSAVTVLYDIPELLTVCRKWDAIVRRPGNEGGHWFAPLRFSIIDGSTQIGGKSQRASECNMATSLVRDIRELFNRAGLPYHSPHKFRHGHATYGLKLARDIGDLKAVSQNLMHANIGITDGIYAILSADDMQERIAGLGRAVVDQAAAASGKPAASITPDLAAIVEEAVRRVLAEGK